MLEEAEAFVDGAAEPGGVEGDDADVAGVAVVDGVLKELGGKALASGLGGGVEVEQVGAAGRGVEIVRGKVHVEDAAGGEDLSVFLHKEADVAVVGEALGDPGEEVGVHGGVVGVGGEVVVGEHGVALLGDESGVGEGGAAEGGHRR